MDTAGAVTRLARSPAAAAALFATLSIFVTWPLAAGLTRDVPADYGDPLYAAWAIAWVSRQLGRMLSGDLGALIHFFDANQLYPERASLAFSDHFVAQALPVAPLYWLTGNPILSLNAAYLVAFALSGTGAFLLVRELTGSSAAGVAGGVVLAFNEFALYSELAHLQVISTGWMPLTLFALRRYFTRGSRAALAGAGCSLVMSNLSAGYYLVMFSPFVALYCVWEITSRRLWRNRRILLELSLLAVAVAAATLPFVWPYVEARQRYGFSRSLAEAAPLGARIENFAASFERMAVAYGLAALALVARGSRAWRRPFAPRAAAPGRTGFWLVAALLSFWLSLGPAPSWAGESYPSLSLYTRLAVVWPGLDAIRVPARFVSVFLVFFAVLTGLGAAVIVRLGRSGALAVLVLAAVLVGLNLRRPFPLNGEQGLVSPFVNPPASYLRPAPEPPPLYRYLAALPGDVVLVEFPADDLWYNTRYLYFSTFHWRQTLNGFTSFYPPAAVDRVRWLINPLRTPDEAWATLTATGVTHVVLHTGAWDAATAQALARYFEQRGSRLHGRFDEAIVFELPQK